MVVVVVGVISGRVCWLTIIFENGPEYGPGIVKSQTDKQKREYRGNCANTDELRHKIVGTEGVSFVVTAADEGHYYRKKDGVSLYSGRGIVRGPALRKMPEVICWTMLRV